MQKALKQYEDNLTSQKVSNEKELQQLNHAVEIEKIESRAEQRAKEIQRRTLKKELEQEIINFQDEQEKEKLYPTSLDCTPCDELSHSTARHIRCRKGERLEYRSNLLRQIADNKKANEEEQEKKKEV